MRRRGLISRSRQQFWLARAIASRWSLIQRGKRYLQLAQELGAETAEVAGAHIITSPEQDPDQKSQVPLTSYILPVQMPVLESIDMQSSTAVKGDREESAEDEHSIPFFLNEQEEISDPRTARAEQALEVPDGEEMSTSKQSEQLTTQSLNPLSWQFTTQERAASTFEPETSHIVGQSETSPIESEQVQMSRSETSPIESEQVQMSRSETSPIESEQVQMSRIKSEHEQNKFTISATQPGKSRQTNHQQKRIQEQPTSTQLTQALSPLIQEPSSGNQQTVSPPEADVAREESDTATISAKDLFIAGSTDRSPQTWLARLVGKQSTPHNIASTERGPITRQQDGKTQGDISKELSNRQSITPGEKLKSKLSATPGEELKSKPSATPGKQSAMNEHMTTAQLSVSSNRNIGVYNSPQERTITPLSQRTSRFLRPLLGIDPASIQVHRDTLAEQLTDYYQADAITLGSNVELAASQQEDTPKTLGLLAHEFLHVARLREPRFIPPVVAFPRSPSSVLSQASSIDEEALAQQVEAQVKGIAQEQINQGEPIALDPLNPLSNRSVATSSLPLTSHSPRDTWGGLPAPWEPLPDWLVPAPINLGKNWQEPASFPQSLPEDQGINNRGERSTRGTEKRETWPDITAESREIQRAGQERSLSAEAMPATPERLLNSPGTMKGPEPDLDALAQQVYTRLKRRLGVEYRREG